jgi:hypothetical protein
MNGDEKWFVCLLNLVELFTITVFVDIWGNSSSSLFLYILVELLTITV